MEIVIKNNQTLLDIAMQHYGNIEAIAEILSNNPHLVNDTAAVIQEGYEPGDFWPHIKLKAGQKISIDDSNRLVRKNTVKKITRDVTTYISEQWQEQLNKLNNQ